jgi:hypothetical protein
MKSNKSSRTKSVEQNAVVQLSRLRCRCNNFCLISSNFDNNQFSSKKQLRIHPSSMLWSHFSDFRQFSAKNWSASSKSMFRSNFWIRASIWVSFYVLQGLCAYIKPLLEIEQTKSN